MPESANSTQVVNQPTRLRLIRWVLIAVLIGLAGSTLYLFYFRPAQYTVQIFTTANGWGYDVQKNGQLFIHQPTVPGQPGAVGFASREQARRVGEHVVEKLQQTKALPTLTTNELRQLGVHIP